MEAENLEEAEEEESEAVPLEEEQVEEEEAVDPRTLLTQEQIDYFRTIYKTFSGDKKEISVRSIGFVLRMMGLNPTKAQLREHINEIDPKRKGMIDFSLFLLPVAQRINDEPETAEDIIAAFRVFDEEGNGYVYTDFLLQNLTNLSEDLDDIEVELLLKFAETKGTGKIHYVEFVEKMFGISQKANKGKKEDKKKGGKKKKNKE